MLVLSSFLYIMRIAGKGKTRHALMDIIVLVICAVVSGAEGWEAIEVLMTSLRETNRQ